MPNTEIDDIFASKSKPTHAGSISSSSKAKGKGKDIATVSSGEGATTVEKKKKKKKKKKVETTLERVTSLSTALDNTPSFVSSVKRKRVEPETILDPSAPASSAKRVKTAAIPRGEEMSSRTAKTGKKYLEEEDKFRDSRGTGPRRKTDEGFSVYKEDELGIGDEGGDTPLCPFDCDCCF